MLHDAQLVVLDHKANLEPLTVSSINGRVTTTPNAEVTPPDHNVMVSVSDPSDPRVWKDRPIQVVSYASAERDKRKVLAVHRGSEVAFPDGAHENLTVAHSTHTNYASEPDGINARQAFVHVGYRPDHIGSSFVPVPEGLPNPPYQPRSVLSAVIDYEQRKGDKLWRKTGRTMVLHGNIRSNGPDGPEAEQLRLTHTAAREASSALLRARIHAERVAWGLAEWLKLGQTVIQP